MNITLEEALNALTQALTAVECHWITEDQYTSAISKFLDYFIIKGDNDYDTENDTCSAEPYYQTEDELYRECEAD